MPARNAAAQAPVAVFTASSVCRWLATAALVYANVAPTAAIDQSTRIRIHTTATHRRNQLSRPSVSTHPLRHTNGFREHFAER